MSVSVFDIFRVGIGPSSSHTVGPMRAAVRFSKELIAKGLDKDTHRIWVDLMGSLGATGIGHATDTAFQLGLMGILPANVDLDAAPGILEAIKNNHKLTLASGKTIDFDPSRDIILSPEKIAIYHTNAMHIIAQDADGNFSFEMGQRFDSQFYSFPFRKGASNNTYIPREVTDGTAWNFKSACGTFNALVWDGAVVTMNEAGANSSYCTWMGDGSKNARAGIGVLKSGKPFLFNTQGPVTGVIDCKGQTHEDVAAELIAVGCDRAGVVEGSGTPSLVVNGKHTAINKNDPAGDCTGTSLKKLVGALAVK